MVTTFEEDGRVRAVTAMGAAGSGAGTDGTLAASGAALAGSGGEDAASPGLCSTDASVEDQAVEAAPPAAELAADFGALARRLRAVVEEELPDRRVLRFPMARNRGMSAFVGLFAVAAVWLALWLVYLIFVLRNFPRVQTGRAEG